MTQRIKVWAVVIAEELNAATKVVSLYRTREAAEDLATLLNHHATLLNRQPRYDVRWYFLND